MILTKFEFNDDLILPFYYFSAQSEFNFILMKLAIISMSEQELINNI